MKKRTCFIAIAMTTCLLQADTHTWIGGASGSWSTSGNWNPSGPPADGDTVIIDTTNAQVNDPGSLPSGLTVTLSNGADLIQNGGAFRANAGTFTLESGSSFGGTGFYDMGNGTFTFNNGSSASVNEWKNKGTNSFPFLWVLQVSPPLPPEICPGTITIPLTSM